MTDLLMTAAKRLGVPTETSAGGSSSAQTFSIWARWPRHPHEVAQDVLNAVIRAEVDASVTPVGGTPLWRARHGRWTHIGRFEDAVAQLASHVAETPNVQVPTVNATIAAGQGPVSSLQPGSRAGTHR